MKDIKFEYKKNLGYINGKLLMGMKISKLTANAIKRAHIVKLKLFDQMEATTNQTKLKELAFFVEINEFTLQELWGFNRDKNWHKWFNVPKCTCPKMDNRERLGTDYTIINSNCPVHGG